MARGDQVKPKRGTPKRQGRTPQPGSRFSTDVIASNIKAWRSNRGMTQQQLAVRMNDLHHEWSEGIVGFVERGTRALTADELISLSLVLRAPVTSLLDPAEIHRQGELGLDYGAGILPARTASALFRGVLVGGLAEDCSLMFEPGEEVNVHAEALRALQPLNDAAEQQRRRTSVQVQQAPVPDLEAEHKAAMARDAAAEEGTGESSLNGNP